MNEIASLIIQVDNATRLYTQDTNKYISIEIICATV